MISWEPAIGSAIKGGKKKNKAYKCLAHRLLANEHPREWTQLLAALPERRGRIAAAVMGSAIKGCMLASSLQPADSIRDVCMQVERVCL